MREKEEARVFASQQPLLVLLRLPLLLLLPLRLLALQRLKASRAPEVAAAEEAPMFERSEFGRRATAAEERRAPPQAASVRSEWFWLLLPKQK
ncbi:hypothetical protein [Cognatiluteimonas telluris]|uniref:hypothetical protein n=1 Tax=Cognatiluteimonas telluris TaxID=1104775 RepID=UPI001A9C5C20|nr:hypothetical protein [Lysobacter telluris]